MRPRVIPAENPRRIRHAPVLMPSFNEAAGNPRGKLAISVEENPGVFLLQ